MAKKRKAPAKAAAPKAAKQDNVQPSEVKKMPSANKIKELARNWEHTKETTGEISGRLGSALRAAAENNNLHTGAFRQAMREKKMEAGRLADFYDHLDFYRDVLGLEEKAASAPRFDFKGEEGVDQDTQDAQQADNVAPFPVQQAAE